ncbi:MAG: peptidase M15 [Bacteroidetes bacterium]|nr:peptidase M15 [Bacteroidota bacterium]
MISKHITLAEAIKSQIAERYGISNIPTAETIKAMQLVANKCFEPIRDHFGVPISVSSFFRCAELNKKVKGSKTSQHVTGEAIDIDADIFGGVTNKEIFEFAKNNLKFEQLISEFNTNGQPSWIHISYKATGNRNQILIATKKDNKTVYLPYTAELYKEIYG